MGLGTCVPGRVPAAQVAMPCYAAAASGATAQESAANDGDDVEPAAANQGFVQPVGLPGAVVATPAPPCLYASGWSGGTTDPQCCGQTEDTTSR